MVSNLESRVRQEVDSCRMAMSNPVIGKSMSQDYVERSKNIYYGICLGVTRKIANRLGSTISITPKKDYLELPVDEAITEFRRDYLVWNLHQNEYNITKTAKTIGLARESFYRSLNEQGLDLSELRKTGNDYVAGLFRPEFNIDEQGILRETKEEVKEYAKSLFSGYLVFRKWILRHSDGIADRLLDMSKKAKLEETSYRADGVMKYYQMKYSEAVEGFKLDYITKQIHRSEMRGTETAKKMGISKGAFRSLIYRRGMKLGDLKTPTVKTMSARWDTTKEL